MKQRLSVRYLRHGVQIALAVFLLYVGWQFYHFVMYYLGETKIFMPRPPAVEGFLPISALMALRLWLGTGIFDPIHPAGLVIFIAVLVTALFLRKGFCGWLCPIGALSELLGLAGARLGIQLTMPRVLDIVLKSLKYLLLGFFVKIIFIDMPLQAVLFFLQNNYNKVADVKMLQFFLNLSPTAVVVLTVLAVLLLFFRHFWCRYLCPYGALLGILGLFSPVAVKREEQHCIDCKKCDKACPSALRVSEMKRVFSPECVGCMNCVDVCPREEALQVKLFHRPLSQYLYALGLLGIFFGIIWWAKLNGYWQTSITLEEYAKLIPVSEFFSHF